MTQEYIESTLWDVGMHILWQDINALRGTMHIYCVEQTDEGKVFSCMFYSDWSCTIHPLNSVELAVVDKHQDTNVNIGDFIIVKYEGTFYPGEVLHLVPNQSTTVSTMEHSGSKFWKWPAKQDALYLRLPIAWYQMSNQAPNHSIQLWQFSVPELEYV